MPAARSTPGSLLTTSILAALVFAGCGAPADPGDGDDEGAASDARSETATEDVGTGDVSDDTASGDSAPGETGVPSDIPDRITTRDGAAFTGSLEAGERITLELVANQNDLVIVRLDKRDGSTWKPALFLLDPADGSRIRWHEPEGTGNAHVPFEDERIQDGFRFQSSETFDLDLANQADRAGEFEFELTCLSGPCTEEGGGGPDDDGIPTERDNCPETPNAPQANADHDVWGDACDPNPSTVDCPDARNDELERMLRRSFGAHRVVSYFDARQALFTDVENSESRVQTFYTGETFETNQIPNPDRYNTEHVWPRSQMRDEDPPTLSDLNIIFPADSDANRERSNLPFDDVTGRVEWSSGGSVRGENGDGWLVFEPRDIRKGDAARALLYYAVVYERDIDISVESDGRGTGLADEQTLRRWHRETDPVDSRDRRRNEAVQRVQNNRNPFIQCPELVGQIEDF